MIKENINKNTDLKIDFFKSFCEILNWTEECEKVSLILIEKNENQRNFINQIFESFGYLLDIYNDISFNDNIKKIDFLASSIVFTSLIEKISEIDQKFSSNILNKFNFFEIIKNNFKKRDNSNDDFEINADFIKEYIGYIYDKDDNKNHDYILLFLKGIRNKLVHPNGKNYNKTHMYSIGTLLSKNYFPFAECKFTENVEHTAPTFFIKKTIFLECIKEISTIFSKEIVKIFEKYISEKSKKKRPTLNLCNFEEVKKNYKKYFDINTDIYFLFSLLNINQFNENIIEYVCIIYTISKFMSQSYNEKNIEWEDLILPNIEDEIKKIMEECGNYDQYLKNKIRSQSFNDNEWFNWFGKEETISFEKKINKINKIEKYELKNRREKFLIIIFCSKNNNYLKFLLDNTKQEYINLKKIFLEDIN